MVAIAKKILTFDEYLTYTDDRDRRYELVEGELQLVPLPTAMHGDTVDFLLERLRREISRQGLPWKDTDKAGVYIGKNPTTEKEYSRTPDVCVMTQAQWESLKADAGGAAVLISAPLLVIEVVSPDSQKIDYEDKEAEYSRVKIPEYWIVDRSASQVLVLQLCEGKYKVTKFLAGQIILSPTFPELELSVDAILQA